VDAAPQVGDGVLAAGEVPATGCDVELQRHQDVGLEPVELLLRSAQAGDVTGQLGHLRSPGAPDRAPPAIASEILQPSEPGVSQYAELHHEGDAPAHGGDHHVALASQPRCHLLGEQDTVAVLSRLEGGEPLGTGIHGMSPSTVPTDRAPAMAPWCRVRLPWRSGRIASMREKSAKANGRRRQHRVAVALSSGFSPFEFTVACEVFGIHNSDLGAPWYRFEVCAVDPTPIRAGTGFTVDTPWGLDTVSEADTIIVPPPETITEPRPELLEVLRQAHRRGARIVSMCTGAFTLAAAGLLDGRRATTHWMDAEELSRSYPEVNLDPGVLYVDDDNVLTSAGSAAAIDLCLHVVRLDFGAEVANLLARRMVVPPHRDGGQAQFIDLPVPNVAIVEDRLSATLDWARAHLDATLTVHDLARHSAMSPRTFARHFTERTGTTPRQWLLRQRVLLSQRLLETTDLPVEIVATRCGLGSAANLRIQFQRQVRTSPSAYRRTFREAEAS